MDVEQSCGINLMPQWIVGGTVASPVPTLTVTAEHLSQPLTLSGYGSGQVHTGRTVSLDLGMIQRGEVALRDLALTPALRVGQASKVAFQVGGIVPAPTVTPRPSISPTPVKATVRVPKRVKSGKKLSIVVKNAVVSQKVTVSASHLKKSVRVTVPRSGTVKTPNFANPSTCRHEFSADIARGWLPGDVRDAITAVITGREAVGQTPSAVRPVVSQGTLGYASQVVTGGAHSDGGIWESTRDVGVGPTFTVPRELAGQTLRLRVRLVVLGYYQVSDSVDVVVDTALPVAVPTPVPPRDFAVMKVKAPAKVKQGKAFTVTANHVAGKVTVTASHLKKAKAVKVSKSKAQAKITAPRLAKGKKSRTISVQVVMKGKGGNNQARTVIVKVVR